MKILLCGEGTHEIGRSAQWDARIQDYVSSEGWMQVLTRRVCASNSTPVFLARSKMSITILPKEKAKYRPAPPGHGERALAAKLLAGREDCNVVVYMLDADTCDYAEWRRKKEEVLGGFDRIDNGVIGIACIPMSASEAWFLADAAVWAAIDPNAVSHLPHRPEEIWGARDDPQGDHPHRIFARVCINAGVGDCLETRVHVAEQMDINLVSRKCPKSFKVFCEEIVSATQ